jgi:uncharacterized membrane protein
MVVVVFDGESEAKDGVSALKQLDNEGSISVHSGSLIKKNSDVTAELVDTKEEFPRGAIGGTAVGGLIGVLGGPVGVFVGAASGAVLGAFYDLYGSGVNAEFVEEVSNKLTPGKYALVADISEECVTPMDTQMTKLGGQVVRTAKREVEIDQIKGDIAALDAEIAQLKQERKNARGEQKANLQTKIDNLKEKRDEQIEKAKQRVNEMEKERDDKVRKLKEKASNAKAETKALIESRVAQINKSYLDTLTKLKKLEAERLEKKADQLEKKAEQLRNQ